jgi:NitT/TauT family transport system substrate-binding protein
MKTTRRLRLLTCATAGLAGALMVAPAQAADTVILGSVGSASTNSWPVYIGINKGFFAAEDLKVDYVFAQSNAGVNQQLAAGSIDFAINTGLVDPIRAVEKGAPVAIVRIEIQGPPYILNARSSIKSMKELRGKTISVGGAKDITRIFVERMLAADGVKPGEFDMVFAGATSARFAALQSGAVDAAIVAPPYSFRAEAAGFTNLGRTIDYVKDLPFAGTVVNRTFAAANRRVVDRVLAVMNRSIAWLYDPNNRAEAVKMMVEVSRMQADDVEKSYDFLIGGKLFEPTGKVSRAKLMALVGALQQLGDVPGGFDIERLVLPGVTQLTD